MGNFGLGVRTMLRIWRDSEFARKIFELEEGKLVSRAETRAETKLEPKPAVIERREPRRSEALTLLAVLQREARLVDFVKEDIGTYSDAQVGAAVRDLHKACAVVLGRLFDLQPLSNAAEGSTAEVPRNFDPAEFHLTGKVVGDPPFRGAVRHHGWKAAKCELPEWTGSAGAAAIVAPTEIEVK